MATNPLWPGPATTFTPGSLVRARGRDWVVLPGRDPNLLLLRPLTASDEPPTGVFLPLEGRELKATTFAPPDPTLAGDVTGGMVLFDAARRKIDTPHLPKEERRAADQQELEAKREIELLLNQGSASAEGDFYPYRYLATEGFLPGYNFPRLPLRALVPTGNEVQSIDRPRFLGLSEYGPHNVIYHEGRKNRVTTCLVPAAGISGRISRARLCVSCGYIHPRDAAATDVCEHCGTALNGDNSETPQKLLDQPTVRAMRSTRITSDEEERAREGYDITTHYRFAPGRPTRRVDVTGADGATILLEVTQAPRADLWRINHGWRRSGDHGGFTLDAENGQWVGRPDDDDDSSSEPKPKAPLGGVKPYVTDRRNLLLLRPVPSAAPTESFVRTLGYALQRAIQSIYQVEEREVEVEAIGTGPQQRLLLWEAAEGGTGVWDKLLADPNAFAEIAREALRICHFDADTGEADPQWIERCALGCYDCILSFSNQQYQRILDRHEIRPYLMLLTSGRLLPTVAGRDYEAQYAWLRERIDPASDLELRFLDFLHQRKAKFPSTAQYRPETDLGVQTDFYYERSSAVGKQPGVCIFIDGPIHDGVERRVRDRDIRDELCDRGYRVIAVRYDRGFEEQVAAYPEVF